MSLDIPGMYLVRYYEYLVYRKKRRLTLQSLVYGAETTVIAIYL